MRKKVSKVGARILKKRSLVLALTLALILELAILFGTFVLPRMDMLATVFPGVVTLLTNNARAEKDLPQLETSLVLNAAAQAKAEDMAAKGYFSHQSPDGKEPWYWLDRVGYKYIYAGENLAVNFNDSEELVKAWQNSPTHNMNLLGPRYKETGVGIATGTYEGREAVFVVQFFASPVTKNQMQLSAHGQAPGNSRPIASDSLINSSIESQSSTSTAVLGVANNLKSPSFWGRIFSSSRTYLTYTLGAIAGLLLAAIMIGFGRHHPRAVLHGVAIACVLLGLVLLNKFVLLPTIDVPDDTQNAAVIFSQR